MSKKNKDKLRKNLSLDDMDIDLSKRFKYEGVQGIELNDNIF